MTDVMEVPLLNLNNYEIHPTEKNIMVFFFSELKRADYFEILLKENDLFYERDKTDSQRKSIVFGVKRRDFKKIEGLNNLTIGIHRKPSIPNRFLGKAILTVTALLILLSLIGFIVSQLK